MAEKYSERIFELVREFQPEEQFDVALEIGASNPAGRRMDPEEMPPVGQIPPPVQSVNHNSFSQRTPSGSGTVAPVVAPARPAIVASSGVEVEGAVQHSHHLFENYTFGSFVEGKSNQLALAAAQQVAENPGNSYNPLFLYGGVGLGKTHLMHAIAHALKAQHPEKTIMYLSAEKFMYQFVRALRANETMNFKEVFRSVDVLMMDDIQFIAGKESTQEEFFHTFNALVDQNKQIIISADKAPSDLSGIDERLRSRLAWGLVADIHPTTYDLRLGILQSKREQLGAAVPDPVLEFLALKVTSNIRELEGALNRIVAHADVRRVYLGERFSL